MTIKKALSFATLHQHCGSRVTCNPPPTDTDCDFILLIDDSRWQAFIDEVTHEGWVQGGSNMPDAVNTLPPEKRFLSFVLGQDNLIVTQSPIFYARFIAATHVAKQLNIMRKADRIMLFQAVLYSAVVSNG